MHIRHSKPFILCFGSIVVVVVVYCLCYVIHNVFGTFFDAEFKSKSIMWIYFQKMSSSHFEILCVLFDEMSRSQICRALFFSQKRGHLCVWHPTFCVGISHSAEFTANLLQSRLNIDYIDFLAWCTAQCILFKINAVTSSHICHDSMDSSMNFNIL